MALASSGLTLPGARVVGLVADVVPGEVGVSQSARTWPRLRRSAARPGQAPVLTTAALQPYKSGTSSARSRNQAKVIERVGRIVEEKNRQLQAYATIKKFAVLPADFSQEGGELTPMLEVKRKVVVEKYQTVIWSAAAPPFPRPGLQQ